MGLKNVCGRCGAVQTKTIPMPVVPTPANGTQPVPANTSTNTNTSINTNTISSEKKSQLLTIKAKSPSVKASKLKKKKQTIKKINAFTIKNAQGAVTFRKKNGSKKLSISNKGVITVKKGTKKGTYKITVIVTAAGNDMYKAGSKTVTVKVKVN